MAQTGAVQYALWSSDGWSSVHSVGKVVSGRRGLDGNVRSRRSIGGQEVLVGGVMVPKLSFSYLPEDGALLAYIKRSVYPAGALPQLGFEAGTDTEGLRISGAQCHRCVVELAVEEALRVDMDWWSAEPPTTTSGGTMTPVGSKTFEWYRGQVSTDEVSYAAQRVRVTVANNLLPVASLDARTAGQRRYPDELAVGPEEVTVVADYLADPGHDLSGDDLPVADVQVTAGNGTQTLTVVAADVVPVAWEQRFEVDELVLWRVEYRLPANRGTLSVTVA